MSEPMSDFEQEADVGKIVDEDLEKLLFIIAKLTIPEQKVTEI
jgi:hypothetical protein